MKRLCRMQEAGMLPRALVMLGAIVFLSHFRPAWFGHPHQLALAAGFGHDMYTGECQVRYLVKDQWQDGFTAEVVLVNGTDATLDGWRVAWQWPGAQKVTGFWSSHMVQDDHRVSAESLDWNRKVAPHSEVSFGFQASFAGKNELPALFAVIAAGCPSASDPSAPLPPSPPNDPQPAPPTPPPPPAPGPGNMDDDWLHADGSAIVDAHGRQVWLTGLNWFGFNTGTNAFDGLWAVNLDESLQAIALHGFNLLRVPISTELTAAWMNGLDPAPRSINLNVNPSLAGKGSLFIFDETLRLCRKYGIKVLLDVHSPASDAMGHMYPLWYKGSITPEVFYSTWEWLALRYRKDDTVVAFDLKNEPHGKPYAESNVAMWDGSTAPNNWRLTAQTAALRILRIHPRVLVLVEGVEATPIPGKDYTAKNEKDYHVNWWGGNLRGVRDHPVELDSYQAQLVYSPHDYGPSVYKQPWFYKGFNRDTLYKDVWHDNWSYIMEENIAPLLIGEWGGFLDGGDNETWLHALREEIIERHIHHTFWCFNANSGDTGGLVGNDFKTWDTAKYQFLQPALWHDAAGRFVGLDHLVPLGSVQTGTTVSAFYANGGSLP